MIHVDCRQFFEFRVCGSKLFVHDWVEKISKKALPNFSIGQVLEYLLEKDFGAVPNGQYVGAGDTLPRPAVFTEDFADEQRIDESRELGHGQYFHTT